MGMNYYIIVDPCGCCGKGEKYHLCRSFRLFRGYSYDDGPFGATIRSWADWEHILRENTGYTLVDEEGVEHPLSYALERVAAHDRKWRDLYWRDHVDSMRRSGWYPESTRRWWQDTDGYTIHDGEFF